MRNTVIFASAVLAMAASSFGARAVAQETNALSRLGDDFTRMPMTRGPVLSQEESQSYDNSTLKTLQRSSNGSNGENLMMAAPLGATSVIVPPASLVASRGEQRLLSSGAPETGSGFAPIVAALAGHTDVSHEFARSADKASLAYMISPKK
jgi:hypothetical protein